MHTNPIVEERRHDSEDTDNHSWQAAEEDKEINTECLKFGPFKNMTVDLIESLIVELRNLMVNEDYSNAFRSLTLKTINDHPEDYLDNSFQNRRIKGQHVDSKLKTKIFNEYSSKFSKINEIRSK